MFDLFDLDDLQVGSARPADVPLTTLCAGGGHAAITQVHASAEDFEGTPARSVAAFLTKYFGTATGQSVEEPMHTMTTKHRVGLVTVNIVGADYVITDIGMRMLTPREQFRAQGFPDSYIIDRGHDGRVMPKTQQTEKCGNSVPPDMACALAEANAPHLIEKENAA